MSFITEGDDGMALRPESSVSIEKNEFGEVEFVCDRPGPVIHRTPEELGLARVVKDEPPRRWLTVDPDWNVKPRPGAMRAAEVRRDRGRALEKRVPVRPVCVEQVVEEQGPLEIVGGEPVRMPARAQMGAEPLSDFIRERKKGAKMRGKRAVITEEQRQTILTAPLSVSNHELAKVTGLRYGAVWKVRKDAGLKSTAKPGFGKGTALAGTASERAKKQHAALLVGIDPHAPGTAAAMMRAIDKIDGAAAAARVHLELTHGEVARYFEGLDPVQRNAFLAAGMKAALLA